MRVTFDVGPATTNREFADIVLRAGGAVRTRVDLDYRPVLDRCGPGAPVATDLLLIAASVYATDKAVSRRSTPDGWTRNLAVDFPVSDPDRWAPAHEALSRCLCFLTGDRWEIRFVPLPRDTALVQPSAKRAGRVGDLAGVHAVSLFSGGLDSLIGVIDWLEREKTRGTGLLLVGHHDRHAPGPFGDQRGLLQPVAKAYPGRSTSLLTQVGISGRGAEITYRSRSLLFLAMGVHAAAAVGAGTPVLIPENGTIALNLPLTPARRGTCSTRTAHPHYLALLQAVLAAVEIPHPIENPLFGKTKGECVSECQEQALLRRLYGQTVSCAKRGHRSSWVRRDARQCGRCMPCLYRRAALHAAGWDREVYGSDVCTGEVPFEPTGGRTTIASADLRAMLACLRHTPSEAEIGARLLANGRLTPAMVRQGAATVARTLDEVRTLFRDKGTAALRAHTGITTRLAASATHAAPARAPRRAS